MNSLNRRIQIKVLDLLNRGIGKMMDGLEKIGLRKPFAAAEIVHYGPPEEVVQAYPLNFKAEDAHFFTTWKSYHTLELACYRLKEVRLSDQGVVMKGLQSFVPAFPHPVFRYRFGLLYNLNTRLGYRKLTVNDEKPYLLIYDFWAITNYYHWCVDSLCRIYLSTRFLPDTYTLLLPEGVPSYITDSLSFFGITRVRLIPRKAVLQLPELFLMNYAAGSGRHHPRILSEVRNKIRSGLAARSAKPFRKIYVSRSRQQSRKIANETEVKQMLEQHGFETVYFEGMSINQQIERMQECSVFVSSHGANMTNTLFLPAGAQVLELINDREPNFCYWSLCSCIGIAYFYQLSPLSGSNHIRVDLETLETNLERMQTHS